MKPRVETGPNAVAMITRKEVLRNLNRQTLPPEAFRGILQARVEMRAEKVSIATLMRSLSTGIGDRLRWYGVSNFNGIVAARLRQLTDDWIETGLGEDGTNCPDRRQLARTSDAFAVVRDCAATNPCRLFFHEKTAELVVIVGEDSGPPHVPFTAGIDPIGFALREADRMFTSLMVSGWKYELSKCRHCEDYFFLKKTSRSYRHGTFCSREHQGRFCAAACTNARRERSKIALVDCAAHWLLKQRATSRRWLDDRGMKTALAGALSERIARDPNLRAGQESVRVNWVTRNAAAIEKRRRELVTLR